MAVTLKQIAEEAKVSQMTVSRILNRKDAGQVSPEVAAHVRAVAERLNYQPNQAARALRSGQVSDRKKPVVTFLLPCPNFLETKKENPEMILEVFNSLLPAATGNGIRVETLPVSKVNSPFAPEWDWLEHLDADSRVFAYTTWFLPILLILARRGCRIALLSGEIFWRNIYAPMTKDWGLFTSLTNDGMIQMVHHLLDKGCERIAVASQYLGEPSAFDTLYHETLDKTDNSYRHPIRLDPVMPDDSICRQQLAEAWRKNPFDSLILEMPMDLKILPGASLAEYCGLPASVKIICKYDRRSFETFSPTVSAVRYPIDRMTSDAVEFLLANELVPGEWFYRGTVMERESTQNQGKEK